MSDYPDIEREVPAWERMKPIFALPGSRFSPEWLTGLAQFVRAVQKPLEERIAALEEETAWIKRHMPAREVERIAATIPTEEKPQYPSCLGCIHYSKSPAEDPCSRCYGRSFYTAKSPTPPEEKPQVPPTALGPAPYGYCPRCGEPGFSRERRINGNDTCRNGHVYPSSQAMTKPYPNPNYSATPPDLAERLAEEAAEELCRDRLRDGLSAATYEEILLPLFRRAVEGSKGGEE